MTIAQQFTSTQKKYLEYDFEARKLRRNEAINKEIARKNLLDMKKILEEHHVNFFLLYGTVLGALREKDFISHDTDTDIGIFEKEKANLIESIPSLLDAGFTLIRTKFPDDLVTFMREDEYIDIGIFTKEKHALKEYYTYQGNLIDLHFLDTLEEIEFLGEKFYVPSSTELFLEKNYGKDWRIPCKDEPAMNLGYKNSYYRLKRMFLRTALGKKLKPLVKKLLGRH